MLEWGEDDNPQQHLAWAREWADRHKVTITPKGMFILYHGTTHAEKIRQSGFFNSGSLFETEPESALDWANRSFLKNKKEQPIVMKVLVDPLKINFSVFASALEKIPVIEIT
jgi:hypothetical protein